MARSNFTGLFFPAFNVTLEYVLEIVPVTPVCESVRVISTVKLVYVPGATTIMAAFLVWSIVLGMLKVPVNASVTLLDGAVTEAVCRPLSLKSNVPARFSFAVTLMLFTVTALSNSSLL